MKVDVEELEAWKRRLSVEAPVEVVDRAWEKAYGNVRKEARLPGFRKGHVPKNLVKLHFADDVRREVARQLIPDLYRQALEQSRIDPIDEPDVKDVTLEEGAPLTFTAVVEVRPVVHLGDYKGVEVQHAPAAITEAEVDETLGRVREQHAELRTVDRTVDHRDVVIVDYTLTPEGLPPVSATGYEFVVGDGTVMPEIDEAVVGMAVDEERQVAVRFPADHGREDLRGKSGIATVKVVEVKEKVLPELDDEFAKGLGEYETLDALKGELRRQLATQREHDERRALEDKIVDAVLARHDFPVPEAMVMRQIAHVVQHTHDRMRRQGVDPEKLPWDYPKLLEELRPKAEKAVRRGLVLDAIAAAEALEPTDADVEAEIERIAQQSQRPPAAVRGMLEKSGEIGNLRPRLRENATLDFLIRHAATTP